MSSNAKKTKPLKRSSKRFVMHLNLPIQVRWNSGKMQTTAVIMDLSHDGIKIFTSYDFNKVKELEVITLKGNLKFKVIKINKSDDFSFLVGLKLTSESPSIEDVFSSYIEKSIETTE